MQMFQRRHIIRISFLPLTVLLLLLFASTAQAQESGITPPVASGPPPSAELANCIAGTVWYDGNANGVVDMASEDPMNGASVTLLSVGPFKNETGPYVLQDHQLTNGGYYVFCGLQPGTYEVRVQPAQDTVMLAYRDYYLNGYFELLFWPYEQYVKYFLKTTTGNQNTQVELEQGKYAEVSVGFSQY